jgi:hypothetical protein
MLKYNVHCFYCFAGSRDTEWSHHSCSILGLIRCWRHVKNLRFRCQNWVYLNPSSLILAMNGFQWLVVVSRCGSEASSKSPRHYTIWTLAPCRSYFTRKTLVSFDLFDNWESCSLTCSIARWQCCSLLETVRICNLILKRGNYPKCVSYSASCHSVLGAVDEAEDRLETGRHSGRRQTDGVRWLNYVDSTLMFEWPSSRRCRHECQHGYQKISYYTRLKFESKYNHSRAPKCYNRKL